MDLLIIYTSISNYKLLLIITGLCFHIHSANGYLDSFGDNDIDIWKDESPYKEWNSTYAPYEVLCPSISLIREAGNTLNPQEKEYLFNRNKLTELELIELFDRNKIDGFDYAQFSTKKSKPTRIALAISGGGYRSMLIGGGVLEAYDKRTPGSDVYLGGLLQSMSYIAGISGGSWLVMSNLVNNFVPVHSLKDDSKSWTLQQQLLEGIPSFDQPSLEDGLHGSYPTNPGAKVKKDILSARLDEGDNYVNDFVEISDEIDEQLSNQDEDLSQVKYSTLTTEKSLLVRIFQSMFLKETTSNNTSQGFQETSWKSIFSYYQELHIEVRAKRAAGFYLSFTDYWGRALSRKIFTMAARAPGATITACTELGSFKTYQQPFPIICTIEKKPKYFESSTTSHLFEFTPFEFGSWDSYLGAFVPVKYLGSSLYDGESTIKTNQSNVSICISGFDNIGFITGTSSSLFNHVFVYVYHKLLNMKSEVSLAIETILKAFGLSSSFTSMKFPQLHPDYALYSPNPFYGYQKARDEIKNSKHMYLVDGGDDGQNIPFQPFLVPSREIDLIISYDMTADIYNYPNGTTLRNSHRRFHNTNSSFTLPHFYLESFHSKNAKQPATKIIQIKSSFPKVPTAATIVSEKLNKRPVFLGCDLYNDYQDLDIKFKTEYNNEAMNSSNSTFLPPLIIYNANTEFSYPSNTSTFKLSYSKEEVNDMIRNGYNIATYMNSTYYHVCLNCAILKREFDRISLGMNQQIDPLTFTIPKVCEKCYDDFCWSVDNKSS